jgi:L-alanine-DL-glutamate epimerase-like enolase superfamily enzyme
MALWDLAGKTYNIPVYQLLGGKHREQVRLYSDTTASQDPVEYGSRMKARKELGYTFMKMDFGIGMLRDVPGALVNGELLQEGRNRDNTAGHYEMTEHPFTRVQITDKGIDRLCEYVAAVREAIGYDIPLAADHFGHIDVNSCIRLGQALEPYQLAWLEDLVPWFYTDMWRQITLAINTPTLTGEDIYLKEEFVKLIDTGAVDMIHPDLATAGGIMETKKIGDYAEERGVAMAMHFAGSPVSFLANVHCAAATRNFVALEHHSVDIPWWDDLVTGIDKPIVKKGYVTVPELPGLGVELNEAVIREHMDEEHGYFDPTPEWDKERSWDRLWS